jgi:hypothetical protein
MRQQIRRFSVHQTAKLVAMIYGLLSLIIVPIIFLVSRAAPGAESAFPFGGAFLLLVPVLYAVFGYLGTALACFIYNFVAGFAGGVEFDIEPKGGAVAP